MDRMKVEVDPLYLICLCGIIFGLGMMLGSYFSLIN